MCKALYEQFVQEGSPVRYCATFNVRLCDHGCRTVAATLCFAVSWTRRARSTDPGHQSSLEHRDLASNSFSTGRSAKHGLNFGPELITDGECSFMGSRNSCTRFDPGTHATNRSIRHEIRLGPRTPKGEPKVVRATLPSRATAATRS